MWAELPDTTEEESERNPYDNSGHRSAFWGAAQVRRGSGESDSYSALGGT